MLCRIGEIEVWRILEWQGLFLPPEELFPNAPPDVAQIMEDLAPGTVDAGSGRIILPVQAYLLKTPDQVVLVDTGIGTIQLLQDTEIRVQRLDYASDNGHITHLYVPRGQVHVNLRRFTHRGSELEIETPAGVSGVRGTEFGVTVQSDGFTGIVTREGAVAVEAQSRQVLVPAGYQTTIRPGEPPLEPLVQSPPTIDYRIDYRTNGSRRWALLIGQVDLVNRVYVNGEQQQLNYWREFVYEVSAVRGTRVEVTVLSPLNERADYDIALF